MNKWVQRIAALVVLLAIVLGITLLAGLQGIGFPISRGGFACRDDGQRR